MKAGYGETLRELEVGVNFCTDHEPVFSGCPAKRVARVVMLVPVR